ncbi:hypothetical protein [Polluticaenibacter yanchengensis]|uniref:Uncharacterized protein n=1 Tax=Polluticaenibacter yanchengensis TaxID=3014562 RepID=A0ABT4UNB7_9BACT|nr:hypothetical protein [Chitinophagaceae bacterium LY-5]
MWERKDNYKETVIKNVSRNTALGAESSLILINSLNPGTAKMTTRIDNQKMSTYNPIYLANGLIALTSQQSKDWVRKYFMPTNPMGPNNVQNNNQNNSQPN